MYDLPLKEVLRLAAPCHVDVVHVLHLVSADLARLLLTGVGNLVTMDGAHLVPTTTNTALVRHDAHEDGVSANDLLHPVEHNLASFRVNVILLDENEEAVVNDVEVVLYFL